jgi:hypothetical protein
MIAVPGQVKTWPDTNLANRPGAIWWRIPNGRAPWHRGQFTTRASHRETHEPRIGFWYESPCDWQSGSFAVMSPACKHPINVEWFPCDPDGWVDINFDGVPFGSIINSALCVRKDCDLVRIFDVDTPLYDVTHWQPLPPLPIPEEKEKVE